MNENDRQAWTATASLKELDLRASTEDRGPKSKALLLLVDAGAGDVKFVGFVSIDDAADFLRLSKRFVQGLIAKRELSVHKFGRATRLWFPDVQKWAFSQRA